MKDEIPEIFWELVKARFEKMPSNLRLVIGGVGSLKKEEILKHIEKKDEIGELLVRMEMEYLKLLKEEVESYEEAFNNITLS
jgi:hypothetical protein